MAHCIDVKLSNGSSMRVQVEDGVTELPKEDIEALEQYIAYRIEKYKKTKPKRINLPF